MSSDSVDSPARARWNSLFQGLQKMGRSLQLPIAVLPAAGILNRLGQPDVFGEDGLGWTSVSKVMTGAGGALLDWRAPVAVALGAGVVLVLSRHTARRFGGVTGDVLGAATELAATAALVVLATT